VAVADRNTEQSSYGYAAVARHAGVSIATVSNVINRPEIVSETTRTRVLASMADLEFVPNRAAAALRQGTNRMVGLVVPEITNPFYSEIARGVTDAADEVGYAVALCVSNDEPAREGRQLAMLAEHRAAGVLMVPISADQTRLRRLRTVGGRLVLVDRLASAGEGCAVAIDDVKGGRLAVDHLLRSGRQNIVLINGARGITQCDNRRTGARQAMAANGRDPDELVEHVVADMSMDEGRELGHRLARTGLPDGVFCINDLLAAGLVLGLHDAGVAVPDDVAIVGYGDLDPATHGIIALTTVEQPKYELGRAAWAMLLTEISEAGADHRHSTVLYTPSLIVRESAP
jgi:LacI family transcriptional regulator